MILHRNVKITMYQLGHRPKHHYIRLAVIVCILAGLVVGGVMGARQLLQPSTVLNQSNAVVKNVPISSTQTKHIIKGNVSFDVPSTWQEHINTGGTSPLPLVTWQGTVKDDRARWLDVYIDDIPTNLAVNHLLPVEADGDHLNAIGTTSDNCVNFTDKTAASTRTGTASAKWNGVNFLCDIGNYERDVVAIGSDEGMNMVTLTSQTTGKHRILLVYTDNSPNPDYTTFAQIVKSFAVN